MDLVVFDNLVVAGEPDRHVRDMVDQVVRDAVPDAKRGDSLLIDRIPASRVMNVVVISIVLARGERLTVASLQMNAALACLVNIRV
jgi:hypothetical protein